MGQVDNTAVSGKWLQHGSQETLAVIIVAQYILVCVWMCMGVRNTKMNATNNLTNIYCVKFIVLWPLGNTK